MTEVGLLAAIPEHNQFTERNQSAGYGYGGGGVHQHPTPFGPGYGYDLVPSFGSAYQNVPPPGYWAPIAPAVQGTWAVDPTFMPPQGAFGPPGTVHPVFGMGQGGPPPEAGPNHREGAGAGVTASTHPSGGGANPTEDMDTTNEAAFTDLAYAVGGRVFLKFTKAGNEIEFESSDIRAAVKHECPEAKDEESFDVEAVKFPKGPFYATASVPVAENLLMAGSLNIQKLLIVDGAVRVGEEIAFDVVQITVGKAPIEKVAERDRAREARKFEAQDKARAKYHEKRQDSRHNTVRLFFKDDIAHKAKKTEVRDRIHEKITEVTGLPKIGMSIQKDNFGDETGCTIFFLEFQNVETQARQVRFDRLRFITFDGPLTGLPPAALSMTEVDRGRVGKISFCCFMPGWRLEAGHSPDNCTVRSQVYRYMSRQGPLFNDEPPHKIAKREQLYAQQKAAAEREVIVRNRVCNGWRNGCCFKGAGCQSLHTESAKAPRCRFADPALKAKGLRCKLSNEDCPYGGHEEE